MHALGRLPWLATMLSVLLVVPSTGLASHNSVGAHANIVTPDEVDLDAPGIGELAPDVGPDQAPSFHPELSTPRPAPIDQSGQRYDPADGCTPWSSFDTVPNYEQALLDGHACYIGYMDGQLEYVQITQVLGTKRSEDLLYPANPDDPYCRGQEDTPDGPGPDPVDAAIARADRSTNDPRCSGSSHTQFAPGFILIDPDLLDAPASGTELGGTSTPGAADATGTETASGTLALPLLLTPYVFLFGEPHPSRADDASPFRAGEGPFGPDPTEGGSPLIDLEGACGERTRQCRLLQPADILRYDTNAGNLEGEDAPAALDRQARVCQYTPLTTYEHPKPERRRAGICGPQGRVMDNVFTNTTHGGLAMPGVPGTWQNVLPGWYRGAVMATGGEAAAAIDVADEHTGDPTPASVENDPNLRDYVLPPSEDTDGHYDADLWQVFAVNPRVPQPSDQLWCLTPNLLTTGDDTVLGVDDPGVYGTYQADAIDLDVHPALFQPQYRAALDVTHPTLRPLVTVAEDLIPGTGGRSGQSPLPAPVDDATARATPLEEAEPDTPDTPETFQVTRPGGIGCTPDGTLTVRDGSTTLDGALRFDARLQANTANDDQIRSFPQPPGVLLKDPTRFDDGLPASEDDTQPSPWWPDLYSFSGRLQAVLDSDDDGTLEPCTTGSASANADACLWQGLWDAYNPACNDIETTPCRTLLERLGYDTEAGVGMAFTLVLSGPVLVIDEDRQRPGELQQRTDVIGEAQPTARQCIVGTSTGFADRLAALEGTDRAGLADALCPDVDGERVVIEDAFDDQTAVDKSLNNADERGFFSAAIQWTRPVPTPDGTARMAGIGTGDTLCVHAYFTTQESTTAADTIGNLGIQGAERFTDCDAYGP